MKTIKLLLRQAGAGLAQVTMAAAVLGAVGMAIMSSSGQNNKRSRTVDYKTDVANATAEIAFLLSNPLACQRTFANQNAVSSTVTVLKNKVDAAVFNTTHRYGQSGLKFAGFEMRDVPGPGDDVHVVASGTGSTNLIIHFQTLKGTFYDTRSLKAKLRLSVTTNASSQVVSCKQVSTGGNSLWSRVASSPQDIQYNTGAVGLGTSSPSELLSVEGGLSALNAAAETISIGGDTTDRYKVKLEANKPLVFRVESTGAGADLQAKHLNATGTIIMGSPAVSCNAGNTGALRYHTARQYFQFCNGTHWLSIKPI